MYTYIHTLHKILFCATFRTKTPKPHGEKRRKASNIIITVKLKCYILIINTLSIKNITPEAYAQFGVHSCIRDLKTLTLCAFVIKFGN